ncbi:MAG: DEAD/DEAH box helicase [Chitinophagia bacterium]|nr:DEAD/DEAH box helicase [Chitinophagia bacterium]
MTSFSSFPMREELLSAVAALGFENPTPIQQKVIPTLLSNPRDIIGLAQTGTGKTAAYGLPILHHLDESVREIQCLILSPTRELCMQIQTELNKYGDQMRGLKIAAVYGGVSIAGQIKEVKAIPQVVVATPGRLIDLMERKVLTLEDIRYVVLDEADEMLNMGFREDIEFILKCTPPDKKTWLFSATMSNDVRNIAKRFMNQWEEFSVAAPNVTNENIDHQYYVTQHHNRFETLRRLLDFTPGIYGIIFTRTKQDAQEVSEKLMKMGYHVSPLHGDLDQKMRTKVLDRFKEKQLQCIVATDVAARGIDVNDISHVINYELPDDPEVYTHRSGRTARAGKSGICMSIVSPKQISNIRQIEKLVKQRFHKSDIPDGAEVIRKRLFFYVEQIANAQPEEDFAKIYYDTLQDEFSHLDKDLLIKKLLWLQLKETIAAYQNSDDLNAGYEGKSRGSSTGNSARLFINLGEKDGLNAQRLLQFICESTDIEPNMVEKITVRDLSSFFNVPADAADYIKEHLINKKYKNRKIRIDEADQIRSGNRQGGGNYRGGNDNSSYRGGNDNSHYRNNDRPNDRPRYSGDVRTHNKKPGGGRDNRY